MPRKATRRSILTMFKQQTTKALASLQKEISEREKELEELKAEAARWESVVGKEVKVGRAPVTPRQARRRAKSARRAQKVQRAKKVERFDWNAVLKSLPKRFTAREVSQKTGKSRASIYSVVSRWAKGNKIKRSKDGYQKV